MIIVTRQNESISPKPEIGQSNDSIMQFHCYCLAGENVVFQTPSDNLNSFKVNVTNGINSKPLHDYCFNKMLNQNNAELHYQGMAQFEERLQEVIVWSLDGVFQINVSGQAVCHVNLNNEHVHVLNSRSIDNRLNLEVVTGPALIPLFAQLGVFCLHAGAVSTPYGNILIIGESGLGKSTLSADAGEGWQQLTDDISPLVFKENDFQLENYPQLKLKNNIAAQPFPEQSTIDLIIRLDGAQSDQVNFKPLNKTNALLQFVRHTVAAKLFDSKILKLHTEFASNMASSIPMVELSYPRDLSKLEDLRESICNYLKLGEFS